MCVLGEETRQENGVRNKRIRQKMLPDQACRPLSYPTGRHKFPNLLHFHEPSESNFRATKPITSEGNRL